jgi:hypothetical protein
MLAIHWTPVANTKKILKNGIRKSKNGLYCFPLTGNKLMDKWWVNFFNQYQTRNRKQYNGIIFRIVEGDLPAYFGHWVGASNKDSFPKQIDDLKSLEKLYRNLLLWRLGEQLSFQHPELQEDSYVSIAKETIRARQQHLFDFQLLKSTFEDFQIVLSQSVKAKRIIKVITQSNDGHPPKYAED